jgi:hypothetical protein
VRQLAGEHHLNDCLNRLPVHLEIGFSRLEPLTITVREPGGQKRMIPMVGQGVRAVDGAKPDPVGGNNPSLLSKLPPSSVLRFGVGLIHPPSRQPPLRPLMGVDPLPGNGDLPPTINSQHGDSRRRDDPVIHPTRPIRPQGIIPPNLKPMRRELHLRRQRLPPTPIPFIKHILK